MLNDPTEVRVAARNLKTLQEALLALRRQLVKTNPGLLEVTSKAYLRRIASMQEDIANYFGGQALDKESTL